MAIADENVTARDAHAHFCPQCGAETGEGRFCAECGTPLFNTTAPMSAAPPPTPPQPRRHPRGLLIGAAAALGLAAIAVAAIIVLTGGGHNHAADASTPTPAAQYKSKLHGVLAPLVASNSRLSDALGALDNSRASARAASRRATQAQSALIAARGGVKAVTVPASEGTLSQQVQQALNDDDGYLQAVAATLSNPSNQSASQLQTLSTGAQSAFVPLAGIAARGADSISGAGALTKWAAAAHRRAQKAASAASSSATTTVTTAAAPSSPAPASSSTDCGGGLTAGPNTSCAFAENVQQAWYAAPGEVATVEAYSPVTDQTYSMSCAPAGSGITCSGANDASVSW